MRGIEPVRFEPKRDDDDDGEATRRNGWGYIPRWRSRRLPPPPLPHGAVSLSSHASSPRPSLLHTFALQVLESTAREGKLASRLQRASTLKSNRVESSHGCRRPVAVRRRTDLPSSCALTLALALARILTLARTRARLAARGPLSRLLRNMGPGHTGTAHGLAGDGAGLCIEPGQASPPGTATQRNATQPSAFLTRRLHSTYIT